MEKSRLSQSQSQIVKEARELKAKLLQIKKKSQQKSSQLIRTELSQIYTSKFEQFKVNLDQKTEDQLTSLELAKELRMSQICDVQNRLRQFMSRLQKQEKTLKEHHQDLSSSYEDAVMFLNRQQAEELEDWRKQNERQLAERVINYQQSIDIE